MQVHRPGDILTQALKKPYSVCLIWHVLRELQCGQCNQHGDDVKKNQYSTQYCVPKFLDMVLSSCQAAPYSQELPSFLLANWHTNTANRLCTTKPANKCKLGATAI